MDDAHWIATTPNRGLRPVVAPGQRDHGLLTQILRQHLGAEHAELFAEPVPNPDGRSTDWYAAIEGEARPLDRVDPATRQRAERRLAALHDDIRALAERLAQSREPDGPKKAALLHAALEIPDPGAIRLIGDRPVLLAWSHLRDSPDAATGVLGSWVRARRPAVPEPPPVPGPAAPPPTVVPAGGGAAAGVLLVEEAAPFGWLAGLLWLLFALLALAIGYLMLAACGVAWPGAGRLPLLLRCPLPAAAAQQADPLLREVARQRQLEQEIARLQRELAREGAACRIEGMAEAGPQPAPPPPAPPPEPEVAAEPPPPPPPPEPEIAAEPPPPPELPECPASEVDRRREEAGGRTGQVTVSLTWGSVADLDLSVRCPNGAQIRYDNKIACGGTLDVDRNALSFGLTREPIENIYWPRKPANGTYQVFVDLFGPHGDRRPRIPFLIQLDVLGERRTVEGSIRRGQRDLLATRFEITDEPPPPAPPRTDCAPAAAGPRSEG